MKIKIIIGLIVYLILLSGCEKSENKANTLTSLNIVHGVVNLGAIKSSVKNASFATISSTTAFGAVASIGVFANMDFPLRIAAVADTVNNVYKEVLNLNQGIYTLYLVGQVPNIESVLIKETIPPYDTEKLNVRVVNISPNSGPLNVTLASSPTVNEFNGLSYKQSSTFRTYAAPFSANASNFIFQIRDLAGTLLTSYSFTATDLSNARNKSVTLIIRGLIGGTGTSALGVSLIANY